MSTNASLLSRAAEMVRKANTTGITQATGVVNFNLEPAAKILYPVITPLRNLIPRFVTDKGGLSINWKAITAINPGNTPSTMKEGRRGGYIDQTEVDYSVNFATIGLENFVTEQAIMAAQGFDNALALAGDNLLRSQMISEELLDLGGNQSHAFGTPATPTGAAVAGGSMTTGVAVLCKVVALTLDAYNRALGGNIITETISRTNGDGTVDVVNGGTSNVSAVSASVTPATTNLSITWRTTAIPGAFGYAWFTGAASGSLTLKAITSSNVFAQTANGTGTQTDGSLSGTDHSANSLAYDGLVTTAATSGAYVSLDGSNLTADGVGGILEIDAFLAAFYSQRKVTPTTMWVSAQDAKLITRKVMVGPGGSGASLFRINAPAGGSNSDFSGGMAVTSYLNSYAPNGPTALPIRVHPNMPQGKIFFDCDDIPYPLSNIPGARRKTLRRDYWQVLWPQVTMNRQTGVYFDGALQVYTPFALGVLDNFGTA